MALSTLTGPRSVVTLGDSLLAGQQGRRAVASRVAATLRARFGEPLVPHDLSRGGLRGALERLREVPELRPALVVVCLGWSDASESPAPSWWVPDAEGLLLACAAIGPTVLVWAPPPARVGNRGRRWHERMAVAVAGVASGARVPVVDLSALVVARYLSAAQSEEVARAIVEGTAGL